MPEFKAIWGEINSELLGWINLLMLHNLLRPLDLTVSSSDHQCFLIAEFFQQFYQQNESKHLWQLFLYKWLISSHAAFFSPSKISKPYQLACHIIDHLSKCLFLLIINYFKLWYCSVHSFYGTAPVASKRDLAILLTHVYIAEIFSNQYFCPMFPLKCLDIL